MLNRLLNRANDMARCAGISDILAEPYVLDIDLDYFATKDALSPGDATTFHRLIANAIAITIATEPSFVSSLRLDGLLTSEYALSRVLEHVESS